MSDEYRSGGKGVTFLATNIEAPGGLMGGLPADHGPPPPTPGVENIGQPPSILSARAERDHWIRLFNRLEAAVRRHVDSKPWNDEHDDQLHASFKAVLKDAHDG